MTDQIQPAGSGSISDRIGLIYTPPASPKPIFHDYVNKSEIPSEVKDFLGPKAKLLANLKTENYEKLTNQTKWHLYDGKQLKSVN